MFRQIKAGKVTINLFTEFCRAANNHVPSMKPLFQRTNDILQDQNDIDYQPSIHDDWQKDVIRMVHQHLIFLNCQTRALFDFHKSRCQSKNAVVERKKLFCYDEGLICPMFKKIFEGNRSRGLTKTPYLLSVISKTCFNL